MNPPDDCATAAGGRTLAKVDRVGAPLVVPPGQRGPGQADDPDVPAPPRRRSRPLTRWIAVGLALVVGAALALATLTRAPSPRPLTQADVSRAVGQGIAKAREDARRAPPDAAAAYDSALPSLVTISTRRTTGADTSEGTGAGVVVSRDGAILTALHVVDGATTIRVRFTDGTDSTATVADQDAATDVAVLHPDTLPQVVVPAVMGGGLRVGDAVFALGHPLGLRQSLSAGVVSALNRSVTVKTGKTLDDLIQFDAAVNPGNSGGPLLDRDGHVVGIVTGLANPSEQSFFIGIGFAVPIATAGGVAGTPPQ